METDNQSIEKSGILDLFEGVDEAPVSLKPITEGLGFKDRVSEGVYTLEVDQGTSTSSDCGTLDIGRQKEDDGTLGYGASGSLNLNSSTGLQPILFHSGHDGLIKKTAKKSGESIFGTFVDALLVLSFSIFAVAFAVELKLYPFNLEAVLAFDKNELGKLFVVFATFFLTYKIGARLFFGKTIGEWSSRHQMGLLRQQHKIYYPAQVLFREVVCLVTGVFTLSFVSYILKKDIGFYFSGLHTYMEQKINK